MSEFNTGTIFLSVGTKEFNDEEVSIIASDDVDGIYVSIKLDERTPLVGINLNTEEAQALIESIQAALQAHWGNV